MFSRVYFRPKCFSESFHHQYMYENYFVNSKYEEDQLVMFLRHGWYFWASNHEKKLLAFKQYEQLNNMKLGGFMENKLPIPAYRTSTTYSPPGANKIIQIFYLYKSI